MNASLQARRLWRAAEPLHAVVYFAPETTQALKDLGLKGFWMGYFAGRAAPMGAVTPPVITATFYNFHPSMVQRAIPDAWNIATPEVIHAVRREAAAEALRGLLGSDVAEAAALATQAAQSLDCAGRTLAAAWAGAETTDDPMVNLWLACSALREHRGDGHVHALLAEGVTGCQPHVFAAAAGGSPRENLQPNRGWSDDDWDDAVERLRARGWLDHAGGITAEGSAAHAHIEQRTNELAMGPLHALGEDRSSKLFAVLEPLAAVILDSDALPFPNPIGLQRKAEQ